MPYLLTNRRDFIASAAAGVLLARTGSAQSKSARIALLSDTHIPADPAHGHRGFSPTENFAKVAGQVREFKPEGAVIDGDLARLEGKPEDYERFKQIIEPMSAIPTALSLGNHDDRTNFQAAFAASNGQPVKGKHIVVAEHGPIRLIVLDSLLYVNQVPGLLGKAQRTWLEEYLKKSDDKPTIVVVHHTLDDQDGSLLDSDRFFRILTPYRKVKAVIYGHSHTYRYEKTGDLHLINLPAIGYNFADAEPVGWVEANLSREGGEFKLRAIAGNRKDDGRTTSLRWRT